MSSSHAASGGERAFLAGARQEHMARDLGLALNIVVRKLGPRARLIDVSLLAERGELRQTQHLAARRLPHMSEFVDEPALLVKRRGGEVPHRPPAAEDDGAPQRHHRAERQRRQLQHAHRRPIDRVGEDFAPERDFAGAQTAAFPDLHRLRHGPPIMGPISRRKKSGPAGAGPLARSRREGRADAGSAVKRACLQTGRKRQTRRDKG